MALNYLLCPTFQVINTGGKPATGGYIECYIHGTRDKYYCYSDWEGTLHPFQIPLDSLGANIVLADEQNSYDVYIYNRYGSLLMSRYKVKPSGGGGIASITSSDGSINVNYTDNGIDLTLADDKASCLKAGAQNLSADGIFTWFKKESVGESIHCDQGFIVLDDGWYHFTATVRLDWRQIPVNETGRITLSTTLTSDVMEFDYSFAHDETFELSGDIYIAPSSTQYIQSGRGFVLSVMGMKTGMVAEMVGLDIHTIVGQGAAGGEKNVHRLLRWYTNASEADEQHPAGDWLHDLDSEDPDDPSGHPMVTADQLFAWYDAGQNFELYEVDGNNGQLGWSAIYRMVTWQDQSDWWSQFAPTPGKACRLEFFRMGMYSTPYRGGLIAYIRYKDEDYMRLYEIMPGQSIWMAEYQEKLPHYASDWHAGDFLRVKQDGSDLEWVPLSGVALSGSYNDLSDVPANLVQDADYVHTDNNFTDNDKSKLDGIEAGAEVNVQSDWTETDSSDDAYIKHKPGTKPVAAGDNITITETASQFVISAADQQQANWNESDTDSAQYIQNKPDLSVYATTQAMNTALAGKQDVISDLATIRSGAALGATATQPADLAAGLATKQDVISDLATIRSGAAAGATAVQPADLAPYATTSDMNTALASKQDTLTAGANIDITNNVISATAEPQVQADWAQTDSSEVDFIKNKPDLSVYATTSAMNTALAGKQDVISDLSDIRAGAALGDTAVQPADLATVATTGDYDDLQDKPDLSIYAESANLATVATTGSYADLTNTPSIPTATSDLTNDSNFITAAEAPVQDVTVNGTSVLSNGIAAVTVPTATSDINNDSGYITIADVPAQVQANWNESDTSAASYIENKPQNLVQDASYVHTDENFTSAEKSKLAGIEAGAEVNVQADWTEADSSSDAYIANKPQNLVQDASYVHTDENFTSAEKTKLAGIAAGAQVNVQSDWAEADNTSDAYIANKPQNLVQDANYVHTDNNFTSAEKTKLSGIEAGAQVNTVTDVEVDGVSVVSQGVASITLPTVPVTDVTVNGTSVVYNGTAAVVVPAQVQSDWAESDTTSAAYIDNKPDLSVYATTSAMTTALADKQDTLTAGSNVQITNNVISATDTTYSAGTGIEITNNEISVETPVDIVAGPGIVIDNPDGNTLRVSQQYPTDETVLWSGSVAMSSNPTLILSESCKNFEYIEIYGHSYSTWGELEFVRINPTANPNSNESSMCISNLGSSGSAIRFNQCHLNWGGLTTIVVTLAKQFSIETNGVYVGTAASTFTKVVGVHRIANN